MDGIYVNPSFVEKEDIKYQLVGSVKRKKNLLDSIKMFWLLYKPRKRRRTIDEIRYVKTREFTETFNNLINMKLDIPNREFKPNKDGRKQENIQESKTKAGLSVPKTNFSLEQFEALLHLMTRTEQDEYKIMQSRLVKRKIEKIRQVDFANVSFEKLQEVYDEIILYEKTHGEQLRRIDTSLIQEFVVLKEEIFREIKIVLLNDMRKLEEKKLVLPPNLAETFKIELLNDMNKVEERVNQFTKFQFDDSTKKVSVEDLKNIEKVFFTTIKRYFLDDEEITNRFENLQILIASAIKQVMGEPEESVSQVQASSQEETVVPQKVKYPGENEAQ